MMTNNPQEITYLYGGDFGQTSGWWKPKDRPSTGRNPLLGGWPEEKSEGTAGVVPDRPWLKNPPDLLGEQKSVETTGGSKSVPTSGGSKIGGRGPGESPLLRENTGQLVGEVMWNPPPFEFANDDDHEHIVSRKATNRDEPPRGYCWYPWWLVVMDTILVVALLVMIVWMIYARITTEVPGPASPVDTTSYPVLFFRESRLPLHPSP